MLESGGYPPGAEFDSNAPYNQNSEIKKYDITCIETLSKTITIKSERYIDNPEMEYHDNDYHNPKQLLNLFAEFLKENLEKGVIFKSKSYSQKLLKECKNWYSDELEYVVEEYEN